MLSKMRSKKRYQSPSLSKSDGPWVCAGEGRAEGVVQSVHLQTTQLLTAGLQPLVHTFTQLGNLQPWSHILVGSLTKLEIGPTEKSLVAASSENWRIRTSNCFNCLETSSLFQAASGTVKMCIYTYIHIHHETCQLEILRVVPCWWESACLSGPENYVLYQVGPWFHERQIGKTLGKTPPNHSWQEGISTQHHSWCVWNLLDPRVDGTTGEHKFIERPHNG